MNIFISKHSRWILKKFLFLSILLCFSLAKSQTPNLYSLNYFSVFTSVGAISNTGLTNIEGNVGTNVGAFTGFPPGNISGSIHIADSTSASVAIDMDSVYAQINRMNCDTTIDSSLGANQVILPGVHCITSAAVLNGNLIFNALGNKNSNFVIKINGAFNSANLSEVLLYDSASSENIFWLINGAVSLGDSSIFMGNIIANGAISLLNQSILYGKALTRQGAIAINNSLIDTTRQMNPLFITVKDYSIELIDKKVYLKWTFLSESSEKITFNLERSVDGMDWSVVKFCFNDNTFEESNYSLIDHSPLANLAYYRLSVIDQGKQKHLKVFVIYNSVSKDFLIIPNPNSGQFTINTRYDENSQYHFKIFTCTGQLIYSSKENEQLVNLSPIKSGLYYIYLITDGVLEIKKLIIENN